MNDCRRAWNDAWAEQPADLRKAYDRVRAERGITADVFGYVVPLDIPPE